MKMQLEVLKFPSAAVTAALLLAALGSPLLAGAQQAAANADSAKMMTAAADSPALWVLKNSPYSNSRKIHRVLSLASHFAVACPELWISIQAGSSELRCAVYLVQHFVPPAGIKIVGDVVDARLAVALDLELNSS
jgi:hypothetical protein